MQYTKEDFNEVYEKNYNLIKFFCLKFSNIGLDTAEDLTQNVFIKAFLNIEKFDGERAKLTTWLCAIAKNECISFGTSSYNKRTVLVYEPELFSNMTKDDNLEEQEIEQEQEVEKDRKIKKIREILKVLGKNRSDVIQLRYFGGLSCKKTSELLGMSSVCVRGKTTRIFKFIRNNFDKEIKNISIKKESKSRRVLMLKAIAESRLSLKIEKKRQLEMTRMEEKNRLDGLERVLSTYSWD